MSTINQTGMSLCVNNSCAGDTVTYEKGEEHHGTSFERSGELEDNTYGDDKNQGQEGVINPDIVAIYMGINDFNSKSNIELGAFKEDYKAIIENINSKYKTQAENPDLQIFVFTLLPSTACQSTKWGGSSLSEYNQNLEKFNDVIRNLANDYDNVSVVDLFKNCPYTRDDITEGKSEYAKDGTHPSKLGMAMISNTFLKALYNKFVGV